jgi:signal transduction histidine kinase
MPGSHADPPGAKTDPVVDTGPVRILLVDDDVRNLDVLESLLHSPEHELVRALTADQALILLLAGEFAAIVLDIQMPGMSGLELASLIKQRKRTQHIPIIFLTAYYQEDEDVLVGYDSGAVDYLTKPINPQILRSKIGIFVDLFRKTRALAASNAALELEIAQRLEAEEALRRANNDLEARVEARTVDLSRANEELCAREAALSASEARLKAASNAKDEFLAALSHELRTPLNPVLLLASHAAGDPALPAAVRGHFDTIRRNVELEARLIDDLLDLTRITQGILRLEPRTIDAHAIVRDAVAIVRPEAEEKGLEVSLELDAAEHTVRGDVVRLQQVFWNLIKNAVKFTPAGGKVALKTGAKLETGEWILSVSDTGIGLTADEEGRVFQAFAQGEHARRPGSHRFGGLGLGLAISRTLVEMHAGKIEARSEGRDRGSVFVVTLPLSRSAAMPASWEVDGADGSAVSAAAMAPVRTPPSVPSAPGRRIRILLVEDHAATRSTLMHLLGCCEYGVTAAESAAAARAAAAQEHFDLIISDIGLPDGSGYELLEELRAVQPGLPGIALSGYGMDEDLARSRLAGFVEHLIKPVGLDLLEAAIATAVGAGAGRRDSAN